MVATKQIQEICQHITDEFHPEKIILFGSYAYGNPTLYSDLDLLVVMAFQGSPLAQAAKIITRLKPSMALDLVVRTPEQVTERLEMQDSFMQEIIEHGKVAYEAQHPKMD